MPVTCSALGDLHINAEHILAHDQHYYITEGLEKLSNGLYVRGRVYITNYTVIWTSIHNTG